MNMNDVKEMMETINEEVEWLNRSTEEVTPSIRRDMMLEWIGFLQGSLEELKGAIK